ncbi:MAG TPA: alpha/beta hydrolase [Solirubrobacterales bacterium]|nr:alpha/beta hydrolase [Solirubrobacterales bacterium]
MADQGTFTPSDRGGSGEPLVLLHGFTDTWRSWDLVRPTLEAHYEVFAPTLAGHAGGPDLPDELSHDSIPDALERTLDQAGIETAHVVGNSLGGFVALQLAARGRAKSVVALAPAGGWAEDGEGDFRETLAQFAQAQELVKAAVPHADAIVATPEGRRTATEWFVANFEHIPAELIVHQMRGAAACPGAARLMEFAAGEGWQLDTEKIECPVRIVWGTDDRVLRPPAEARYRNGWVPQAEWVELDGIGHMPQLDVPTETAGLILGFSD